ncbi:hypothetical protein BJX70DRAFT_390531 [Aspergillus crustosus]
MDMELNPIRAVIWANVTDIPGDPQTRSDTLAEAFCAQVLKREFSPTLQPSSYDYVHIPADIDSDKPLKRWFIIDFDVKEQLPTQSVILLPHLVYLARYQHPEWIFIARDNWKQHAILRARSLTWGGRLNQRRVAEMRAGRRNQNTADLS